MMCSDCVCRDICKVKREIDNLQPILRTVTDEDSSRELVYTIEEKISEKCRFVREENG